jgi:excisionase family DNA binding protein
MTPEELANAPDPDASLWTVEEVRRYLRVSRSWVYGAAARGEIPSLRIGGLLRFDPDAVRAWAHRAPSAPIPLPRPRGAR